MKILKVIGIWIYRIVKWGFYLITFQQLVTLLNEYYMGKGVSTGILHDWISFLMMLIIAVFLYFIPKLIEHDKCLLQPKQGGSL